MTIGIIERGEAENEEKILLDFNFHGVSAWGDASDGSCDGQPIVGL